MDREITRGRKLDDGEWVYGYPFVNAETLEYYILDENFVGHSGLGPDYISVAAELIDGDTRGKYAGFSDINGHDMYEGDIFHLGDKNIPYVIVYNDTGLSGKQMNSSSYVGLQHWKDRVEKIGTIHDAK